MPDDTVHKFEPSDAGRYVAIKYDGKLMFGIVTDVLDEEDARIWYPNTRLEGGGQGTSHIVNIKEVEGFGLWMGDVIFPFEFVDNVRELRRLRLELEDA